MDGTYRRVEIVETEALDFLIHLQGCEFLTGREEQALSARCTPYRGFRTIDDKRFACDDIRKPRFSVMPGPFPRADRQR